MSAYRFISAFLLIIFVSFYTSAQNVVPNEEPDYYSKKTRILFLLDGSGSMMANLGNQRRIDVAKQVLSHLVDSLKVNTNLELALRVYGHQFDRKLQNCQDTKLEASFKPQNHELIKARLTYIVPKGNTPIAYSLQTAASDFPKDSKARNIIILITDGLESCDADPCAVAKALQSRNIFMRPFVVGLGNDANFARELGCLGQYFDAANPAAFLSALNKILNQSLLKTTVSVELLDNAGRPVEKNIAITFQNSVTGEPIKQLVHYRNERNTTDTFTLDPVLSYNMVVHTIPAITLNNIYLNGGLHNVIKTKVSRGSLTVKHNSSSKYGNLLTSLLDKSGAVATVYPNKENKIIAGEYVLQAPTIPPFNQRITISANKPLEVNIPSPGILTILASFEGYCTLVKQNEDGTSETVLNFFDRNSTHHILPGKYQFIYRSKSSSGSKFSVVKPFEMKEAGAVTLRF